MIEKFSRKANFYILANLNSADLKLHGISTPPITVVGRFKFGEFLKTINPPIFVPYKYFLSNGKSWEIVIKQVSILV